MRQMSVRNGLSLANTNWILSVRANVILSAVYLLFIPLIRGTANLDAVHSAECLEQSAALTGVFLLVPLTRPEQNKEIQEVILSRKRSYVSVLLLRLFMALCALAFFITAFAAALILQDCTFPFGKYVFGTFASALALGGVGFLVSSVFGSFVAGCLMSAGYYLANLTGGIGRESLLSLFSMAQGIFCPKYWITGLGVLCILLVLLYAHFEKRQRGSW